ncbi:efflux RND transporter periplasmic adaptor subunit [Rhodoferax aquaticus]|uniref:Efflux RND transporter periplasmic adaptor subunit n=1 Tax=Rhodoferax aquaticus TaxID=2527691 RepID=A0A515ELD5_9BURK|nr:efflux RND transporter periplasmic adaptor subunit [Rhodoferax aquaticus]
MQSLQSFIKSTPTFVAASILLLLAACGAKTEGAAPSTEASSKAAAVGQATPAPSGPRVTVSLEKAQKRDMAVVLKATGTVTSLASVDVRAQVSSTISKVHIREGQFVKAGELLFTLDDRSDEANVAKARAQLAKDMASLADARRQFARALQLFAQNFISQGALDTSQAQVDAQAAAVAADQAAIDVARVALSYSRVVAKTAGRAGAITVAAGSAVQANVTSLVTITQLDPIAVAYSLPQRNLPDALAALKDGGAPVSATLANAGGKFNGRLTFVDNAVDASSGAVKVKATFANKEGLLWPGAFLEVTQTVGTLKDAVVIPQAAVIQTARGTIVYVDEDGKAALKPVKVEFSQGGDAAVTGIKAGDMVVMDGKQNLKPGASIADRKKGGDGAGGEGLGDKGGKGQDKSADKPADKIQDKP